jgi:hypothetical protein
LKQETLSKIFNENAVGAVSDLVEPLQRQQNASISNPYLFLETKVARSVVERGEGRGGGTITILFLATREAFC